MGKEVVNNEKPQNTKFSEIKKKAEKADNIKGYIVKGEVQKDTYSEPSTSRTKSHVSAFKKKMPKKANFWHDYICSTV